MKPAARFAIASAASLGIAWAFAGWTAPESVFTFVSVLSFCQ